MKAHKYALLTAGLSLAMAFTLFACSSDDGGDNPPNLPPTAQTCSGREYNADEFRCENGELIGSCRGMDYYIDYQDCNGGVIEDKNPTPSSSSVEPTTPSSSSLPPQISSSSGSPRCGNVEYNPATEQCCGNSKFTTASQFCSGTTVYSKCGGTLVYSPGVEQCCGSNRYTISTQFCSANTVYSKCGGNEYNPTTHFCFDNVLYSILIDTRDDKEYLTVEIGTQVWMAENLNYAVSGSKCPDNVTANCTTYGRQYDWATAMALATSYNSTLYSASAKHKGVCPTGWHIPSQAEWNTLVSSVGTNPGTKLKDIVGWNSNGNGTDDYGFAALPGGYVEYGTIYDSYLDIGDRGLWWTTSEYNGSYAYNSMMSNVSSDVSRRGNADYDYSMTKRNMLSVRCVMD